MDGSPSFSRLELSSRNLTLGRAGAFWQTFGQNHFLAFNVKSLHQTDSLLVKATGGNFEQHLTCVGVFCHGKKRQLGSSIELVYILL